MEQEIGLRKREEEKGGARFLFLVQRSTTAGRLQRRGGGESETEHLSLGETHHFLDIAFAHEPERKAVGRFVHVVWPQAAPTGNQTSQLSAPDMAATAHGNWNSSDTEREREKKREEVVDKEQTDSQLRSICGTWSWQRKARGSASGKGGENRWLEDKRSSKLHD